MSEILLYVAMGLIIYAAVTGFLLKLSAAMIDAGALKYVDAFLLALGYGFLAALYRFGLAFVLGDGFLNLLAMIIGSGLLGGWIYGSFIKTDAGNPIGFGKGLLAWFITGLLYLVLVFGLAFICLGGAMFSSMG